MAASRMAASSNINEVIRVIFNDELESKSELESESDTELMATDSEQDILYC